MNFWEFSFGWDSGPNWIQEWIAFGLVISCIISLCHSIFARKTNLEHKAILFPQRLVSIFALLLGIDLIKTLLILRYLDIGIPFHSGIDIISFLLYSIGMIVLPFFLSISRASQNKWLQYVINLAPIISYFTLNMIR